MVKFKDSRGAEQEDSASVQVCPRREEPMTPNKRSLRDRTNTKYFSRRRDSNDDLETGICEAENVTARQGRERDSSACYRCTDAGSVLHEEGKDTLAGLQSVQVTGKGGGNRRLPSSNLHPVASIKGRL